MVVMKTIFEQLTLDSTLAEGDLVLPSSWERPGTAGLPSDGWKAIYPHLDGAGVADVAPALGVMALFTAICVAVATLRFRPTDTKVGST